MSRADLATRPVRQPAEAGRRVNVNDLWIAATAVAYALPVVTQDDGYDALADLGLTVIRV